jgi:hypothetical protein
MTIGFDNYRPNQGLLLDLQLREGTGTITRDWAKPYHDPATLVGTPSWLTLLTDLTYLAFNPVNPDRIVIAAAASVDLAFTSYSFSGAVWIYPDAYGDRYLMHKGAAQTGWGFWINDTSPYLIFTTEQAGPTYQSSDGGANLVLGRWQLVGFTRSGASGRLYLNGRDVTATPATHINPADATAGDFYIGTTVGGGAGFYDGNMWRPRIWGRRALAAWEMLAIYEAERSLFGV